MIFRLATKDIIHDWLLSTCLIFAIASIIAPLLILFGLKAGTIQTLRGRLVEDPKNREIRPISSHRFDRDWFRQVRAAHPEISFVIPMTRQISTTVTAVSSEGKNSRLSLMATGADDPLLLENGVNIPDRGECVLTDAAAKALGVVASDSVTLRGSRIIHGRREDGSFRVRVKGVLDVRASGLKAAFVRLDVIEAVEDFKDGRAVPAYGWKGTLPVAYPVYDGAAIFTPEPLSRLEQIMLINNTGFATLKTLSTRDATSILGFQPDGGWTIYHVTVSRRAAGEESIQAVRHRLRGKNAVVLPWVRPVDIVLSPPEGQQGAGYHMKLFALGKRSGDVSTLNSAGLSNGSIRTIAVSMVDMSSRTADISIEEAGRHLVMSVRVVPFTGQLPAETAFAPAPLAGRLNLLRYRDVVYDPGAKCLLLARRGYAGFRMYTGNIDQVAKIQQVLENEGIAVHTEQQRIAEVRRLDRYLSLIFWLIATVGVIGGISALTASLYASVERKKKELNILRLLGLLKRQIVLFPVIQGLILSASGLTLAGLVFWIVARIINHLFSSHLRASESFCTLSTTHIVILIAGLCACSIFSATLAALQAIRLDPAEALRDE